MALKPVYALVADLFFATKIVKTAQSLALEARAFDTAERLIQAAKEKEPSVVLLDCQGLEKEAFRVLDSFRSEPSLSKVPRIGYLYHGAQELKRDMRNAGCEQVFTKSEFTKGLENILARFVHGFSSRI